MNLSWTTHKRWASHVHWHEGCRFWVEWILSIHRKAISVMFPESPNSALYKEHSFSSQAILIKDYNIRNNTYRQAEQGTGLGYLWCFMRSLSIAVRRARKNSNDLLPQELFLACPVEFWFPWQVSGFHSRASHNPLIIYSWSHCSSNMLEM